MLKKEEFEITGSNQLPIVGDITISKVTPEYLVIFSHGFRGFKDLGSQVI